MKRILSTLSIAVAVTCLSSARGAQSEGQDGLQITIVAWRDKADSLLIDRGAEFSVKFSNPTEKAIRLWSEQCQFGYGTLSFLAVDELGNSSRMYKRTPGHSSLRSKPPQTISIPPGAVFSWKVVPSAFFWGEREWKGVPEPNSGKPITLTAVFEISPSDEAKKHGVWTGRITSKPITTLVVDPKLNTPHQYLEDDCPKEALKMIEADPKWIEKVDHLQQTPLHVAAHYGRIAVVRWLLSKGADVNSRAYNRFTPLHLAKDPDVVKLLIEHKANVNAENAFGRTVLEEAAIDWAHLGTFADFVAEREKKWAITKLLLESGAEYDIRSACCLGDIDRVRVLVKDGRQARDKTAMREAAKYGRTSIVKLLLEHGADPEDADYGGLTVSYFAIEQPSVLKLLFDAGADPKVKVEYHGSGGGPRGSTLLHETAQGDAIESAKLLLARGLNVNATTQTGYTPLDVACSAGHAAMTELLIQNSADVASDGRTAMFLAASQVRPDQDEDNARYQAVIHVLERAGVDLDLFATIACDDVRRAAQIMQAEPKLSGSRNRDGLPALHRAVKLDRREIAKLLLDNGCGPDIRSQDKDTGHEGETALLEAAFWGRLEIAEMLIKRGANVNAKAAKAVVPLHEAARMGQIDLARLLLEHGADANAKDDEGKTPIDWSRLYQPSPEMVKLLSSHGGRGGPKE